MFAEENLLEGNLDEALKDLASQVRKDPSNVKYRVFLFQLLALLGEWERALTQLNVAADLDASTLAMVQMYREALRCEALRHEIYATGKHAPLLFGEPEQWLALLMEALRLTTDGKYAAAQKLRDEAFQCAPVTSGIIDGTPFAWIADADSRMGPVLEAIVKGRYYWMPFHRIKTITIEKPEDLRDYIWMPVHFEFVNGGETVGLIPTRYVGSHVSEEPQVRMGHKTIWLEQGEDAFVGLGQRLLTTDTAEHALMDIRKIELNSAT
ncbi:Protein of avirulence locus ImpE [hydrothermal vent metagenome]|uniref:Protein of avirulence locus ImpE n=1 Tax=hydrothermal vent metagenome TaxID=652676 RepID=A0A3B1CQQ7_9ZZZZ